MNTFFIQPQTFYPLAFQNPNPAQLSPTSLVPQGYNIRGQGLYFNAQVNPYPPQTSSDVFFLLQKQQQDSLLLNQNLCIQNQLQSLSLLQGLEQSRNLVLANLQKKINPPVQYKRTFLDLTPQASNSQSQSPISFQQKPEITILTEEYVSDVSPNYKEVIQPSSNSSYQKKVEEMVKFFLDEFGKVTQQELREKRETYIQDQTMVKLFDALTSKYITSKKCREDMTRSILRKAISFLRDAQREIDGSSCKAASLTICKKYFAKEEDLQRLNTDDVEEILRHFLPYKRNSRNRTANTSFIEEIFESEAFKKDFDDFLERFDQIFEFENQKKAKKLTGFLLECVTKNKMEKLANFKRLPWPKNWVETTKNIAYELKNNQKQKPKTTKVRV